MKRFLVCASFAFLFAPIVVRAEPFFNYAGTVNGNTATFNLCWLGDSVVGTFVRDSITCTLAGDNSRQGEMFMSVAYLGRTVAYIKVRKITDQGKIAWKGSMRIEETGGIIPVEFTRTKN